MKYAVCALLALACCACRASDPARGAAHSSSSTTAAAAASIRAASVPADPRLPRWREPTRAVELEVGRVPLVELLGRWTDAGGPDVLVAAPGVRPRLDSAQISIPSARVLAPHEIGPFVERALREHELALAATYGDPVELVSVERWPLDGERGRLGVTIDPSIVERSAVHPALLVQVAVAAAETIASESSGAGETASALRVTRVTGTDHVVLSGRWADVAGLVLRPSARGDGSP